MPVTDKGVSAKAQTGGPLPGVTQSAGRSDAVAGGASVQPAAVPPTEPGAAPVDQAGNGAGVSGIVRCTANGKTSYLDHPCPPGAQAHLVDTRPVARGLLPDVPFQQQLAQTAQPANRQNGIPAPPQPAPPGAMEVSATCKRLAERIAWLDSALRQSHDAFMGDTWTAERRSANGERFRLDCAHH